MGGGGGSGYAAFLCGVTGCDGRERGLGSQPYLGPRGACGVPELGHWCSQASSGTYDPAAGWSPGKLDCSEMLGWGWP